MKRKSKVTTSRENEIFSSEIGLKNKNEKNIVTSKCKLEEEADTPGDLVDFDKVPSFFREPFIISSYRKCDSSAWHCFKSLFQATNETINIWSHVLAFAVFALRFASVFAKHKPWDDTFVYPLVCFAFGICVMLAMSAGAHLFNCMSIKARHVCFFFDYAAISVYTFTAGQVFYFYSRPLNTNWMIFNTPALFLGISAAISFASTWACCYSFCSRSRFDAALKAGTYISSWLFNTSPYLTMLSLCNTTLTCSSPLSIQYFNRHCLFYAGGTLAYVFRVPERLMIGVFDVLGHSHHFLHILCAIGAADEFSAVELDMLQRKAIIEPLPGPTFSNSILLTILVVLGNISVVLLCTRYLNLRKH
ncbi:membrane progestin receptor gamma-A-like [Stylophora pistillata]|uniref:membrane progestin receptor gamma-A-like n=1 Tax=Stylophora pistillata TaxID=50429 RepID=UPI000C04D753|nr:membrane progestin receptor gamma-A-like [Stylophora pistillata]